MHAIACCNPRGLVRRFPTRQETIDRLEAYAARLEAELQGVQERIDELSQEA